MGRSDSMKLEEPGAGAATDEQDEADQQAAQRRSKAKAAAAPAAPKGKAKAAAARTVEELEAALAAAQAENAELKAAQTLPQNVFEPKTPHGKLLMAASDFKGITVAELTAAIDAGEAKEPFTHVLCKDGYYCRRGVMPA